MKKHGIATLDNFVYMITQNDWERSIAELVDACPSLKSNRVVLSRFKAAWESGSNAVKQASQPLAKGGADQLDEMLPESTLAAVSRDFKTKYSLDLDPALEPADSLRSRVYREFRKNTMTVIDARKVKSIIMQATPKLQESVSLPGGLSLTETSKLTCTLPSVTTGHFVCWGTHGPGQAISEQEITTARRGCSSALPRASTTPTMH